MLPLAQASCTPSFAQTNCGTWLGTHPPWTQTSPAAHVPPVPHGATQWFCAQTVPLAQTLGFCSHGVGFEEQTPLDPESLTIVQP
jgi:hypothetical protein